ncbi:hypothetical protein ABN764_02415 [Paenibacillaceae sp. P-4]|uniref:PspA/IM30 family protein n=1 Tax=Paenibacillaceae bacterium P-4 TaxID=3160969 RepID=UPI0032E809B6
MTQLQTYLEYNDPLTIIWRTPPYADRADSLPIINGMITLLEIPSTQERVRIAGMIEVDAEDFAYKPSLEENEYLVNYAVGTIQFHPAHEGKTLLCQYKGKGMIMYPASRIYAMVERSPDVVKTLQDIIDDMLAHLQQYNQKLVEINQAITNATQAALEANIATDNAKSAAQTALDAADQALIAIRNAMKIYKPPVNTYDGLLITYPKPEIGWTVMVRSTGNIYRWDGSSWMLIENFTQTAFPLASRALNGLMSKEDYAKFHDKLELKSIMFVVGKPRMAGVPPLLTSFPFDGEIKNVKAFCLQGGILNRTEIEIQKISEKEFKNNGAWNNILSDNILFQPGETNSIGHVLKNVKVNANDYFRLNITNLDQDIQGVTIQLDVQI